MLDSGEESDEWWCLLVEVSTECCKVNPGIVWLVDVRRVRKFLVLAEARENDAQGGVRILKDFDKYVEPDLRAVCGLGGVEKYLVEFAECREVADFSEQRCLLLFELPCLVGFARV